MKMQCKLKYITILFIVFFININVYSQKKEDTNYYENLELNTDKDLYISGEKIWFYVDSKTNLPDDTILSKIIYVEIFNSNNKTITNGKFRIVNGKSYGFIQIPNEIYSGNYYMRVYTQYLKNYSPILYPTKFITIINPNFAVNTEKFNLSKDIQIATETGFLFPGISNKLAIKISPVLNKKIKELYIENTTNEDIQNIQISESGLYNIAFTPVISKNYHLKLILQDNQSLEKELPEFNSEIEYLSAKIENLLLDVQLISKQSFVDVEDYKLLIKTENFETLSENKFQQNKSIQIPTFKLKEDILYLVLVNKKDEFLFIKPIYVPKTNKEELKINFAANSEFKTKEKVSLAIPFKEGGDNTYFVAAFKNEDKLIFNNKIYYNSFHPVLLINYIKNSFLKEKISLKTIEAAFILNSAYFNSPSFLQEIAQKNELKTISEIRDITIKGQLLDEKNNQPIPNKEVYAAVIGKNKQFHIVSTDKLGEFTFNLNHLYGNQKISISTKPVDSLEVKILINKDFSNIYLELPEIPVHLDSIAYSYIEQQYLNSQLNQSFSDKLETIVSDTLYKPFTKDFKENLVLLKDFIEIPALSEIFDEIIPFVNARRINKKYYLHVYNEDEKLIYKEPLVLIDGVPVFDVDKIMKLKPSMIESISVMYKKFFSGSYIIEGIISIVSKTDDLMGIKFDNTTIFVNFNTNIPESHKVFSNYEKENRIPNFNNILYWKEVTINKNNDAVSFLTSEQKGNYSIIIFNGNNKVRKEFQVK